MSDEVNIRKAVKKAIDEALKNPVKGKSLGEVVEAAVARAIGIERAKIDRRQEVQVTSDRILTSRCPSDSLDQLFDAEIKSRYIN